MKPHIKNRFLFLIAVIFFFSNSAAAQLQPIKSKIYGTIADSLTKKPLELLTIQLKTEANTIVKTTLTKSDGSFLFTELKPLNYSVEIAAVGYNIKRIEIAITDSPKSNGDAGFIYLSRKTNTLDEVTVTARKQLVKQDINGITYDLQADPESKGSSVLEMMRKVPFLSVDGDGNILLNGSSGYKILINGKPSSMLERNGKDMLRSMPASTIKSIEVITNPSSKYDAEGLAGIIKVITNKKVDNGYNGTMNVSHKAPVGGPGAGASFALKQGKFGLSALAGANLYNTPRTESFLNRTAKGSRTTNLDQNSMRRSDSRNAWFGVELSYELDSLNLISAQFNSNGSKSDGISYQNSILYENRSVLQQYNLANNIADSGSGMDLALNYQLGFKKSKERLLTFSYRHMAYTNSLFNSLDVSDVVNFTQPHYHQANKGRSSEQTVQVDYVHAVKKLQIEGGLKSILRKNKSDYQYHFFDSVGEKFNLDPARTDNFNNHQNIFAAYNTYQYNVANWGLKAGLRIEQTGVDARFISGTSHVKQNYLSVIPSAAIIRKFKDRSSLNLAFTQRIQRPGINQLNPFTDRSNPDFESGGNPNLKPAYSNLTQLSYNKSKKASVNIALGYIRSNGLIGPVSAYDAATGITRTTVENIGKVRIVKMNSYLNYPATKRLNLSVNSDVRYASASGLVKSVPVKNEGFGAYVNVSGGYRFDRGWRLNADLILKRGGISKPQSTSNGFASSAFSVQKNTAKEKFTFTASVSNPFTQYRHNREETLGPDFIQVADDRLYFRSFGISLNYRFGKLKEAIRKTKRSITNDDVYN